jgi:hypothetical protein
VRERLERDVAPPRRSAARGADGAAGAAAVLQLQRAAGNRAVADLIGRASLQRAPKKKAGDLDALVLRPGEKRKGLLATSSFAKLAKAVAAYRAAGAEDKLDAMHRVEQLAMKWLNKHAGSADAFDRRRRAAVETVLTEVDAELLAHARERAQGRYMENIENAWGMAKPDPYALQQITGFSQTSVTDPLKPEQEARRQELGLTVPEVAAIKIFTGEDYKYINPTTANNPAWLEGQKKAHGLQGTSASYFEEGTLHAGVAMQGLAKFAPYNKPVYRGASFPKASVKLDRGQLISFNSFASASKLRSKAEEFAYTSSRPSLVETKAGAAPRDVGILYELRRPNGRDVSAFSLAAQEEEVVLLPGSRFRIESVQPISAPGGPSAKGSPITEWWHVKCSNAADPGTTSDTEQPPATAAATASSPATQQPVGVDDAVLERLAPHGGSGPDDQWLRGGALYEDDDSGFWSRLTPT